MKKHWWGCIGECHQTQCWAMSCWRCVWFLACGNPAISSPIDLSPVTAWSWYPHAILLGLEISQFIWHKQCLSQLFLTWPPCLVPIRLVRRKSRRVGSWGIAPSRCHFQPHQLQCLYKWITTNLTFLPNINFFGTFLKYRISEKWCTELLLLLNSILLTISMLIYKTLQNRLWFNNIYPSNNMADYNS